MSLLDRVRTDFAALVANTDDFAETISYTPAGGTAGNITATVIPEESRFEVRDGYLVRIDEIHVSAANTEWSTVPSLKASVSWDSRTWDFSRTEHDKGGGYTAAYFSREVIERAGSVGITPV